MPNPEGERIGKNENRLRVELSDLEIDNGYELAAAVNALAEKLGVRITSHGRSDLADLTRIFDTRDFNGQAVRGRIQPFYYVLSDRCELEIVCSFANPNLNYDPSIRQNVNFVRHLTCESLDEEGGEATKPNLDFIYSQSSLFSLVEVIMRNHFSKCSDCRQFEKRLSGVLAPYFEKGDSYNYAVLTVGDDKHLLISDRMSEGLVTEYYVVDKIDLTALTEDEEVDSCRSNTMFRVRDV